MNPHNAINRSAALVAAVLTACPLLAGPISFEASAAWDVPVNQALGIDTSSAFLENAVAFYQDPGVTRNLETLGTPVPSSSEDVVGCYQFRKHQLSDKFVLERSDLAGLWRDSLWKPDLPPGGVPFHE